MAQLRRDHEKFVERDTAVIAIGPENANSFRNYFTKHKLPFIGLPDRKHEVLRLYGQQIKLFKFGRMPAQVLVDKAGVARFVHYGHDMRDIPPNQEMLELIESLSDA